MAGPPAEGPRHLVGRGRCSVPWYVAGGWAVDLFIGERTRRHSDLEIAVPAGRFPEIQRLFPGLAFDVVASGHVWALTPEVAELSHQTWLRDPSTGNYLLDVFREPHDGPTWVCRRDPSIRLPYSSVVHHTPDGIPYLAPELALLFKAKATRPKDQQDFDAALPLMDDPQRRRLAAFLTRVHPGHRWPASLR
ncbi:hypothetical protein ABT237_13285 [Streptomyces sp. NPDC001581]|uniref:nucleotidyltransferase domain-containing protein n=1 Tax=Streptomyces sp. NPDC001581 TaxID=3154386 RepID=UPI0033297990